VQVWDAREGLFLREVCARDEQLLGVCMAPNGLRVAIACDDGVLRAYDIDRPDAVITQRHSFSPFRAVVYAPDGESIATGSDDGTIKVWDAAGGDMKAHLHAHIRQADAQRGLPKKPFPVTGLCYDATSTKLVSCSADGTIKYWLRLRGQEGGLMALVAGVEEQEEADALEKREIKRKRLTAQLSAPRPVAPPGTLAPCVRGC
jgi:WD40 repeat protein